jgi:hypothetical protein
MSNCSHNQSSERPTVDIVTDISVNERLLRIARQQHKQLYEEHARVMLPDNLEWRVRSVGKSAIAWTLDRRIEGFYQHFNAIHHIAGMRELALQSGDAQSDICPDFIHSEQTAAYEEGFSVPQVLVPYVGEGRIKDGPPADDAIRIGLLGQHYYANTLSSWRPRRDSWSGANEDKSIREYSLVAAIYRVTDKSALIIDNNAK